FVSYKDPSLPSLYPIFESVWTGERETYEMLGIRFDGHPDLRRLFLDEDFEGVYPLRKSFKIKLEGLFVDKQSTK
ncbi:MAG: NADH-quinone oxidoreductase subunit C, partial [Sulfolobaceae archaeon]